MLNGTSLLSETLSGSGRRVHGGGVLGSAEPLRGTKALLDVTVTGARVGDFVPASLATSSRFFELDAIACAYAR